MNIAKGLKMRPSSPFAEFGRSALLWTASWVLMLVGPGNCFGEEWVIENVTIHTVTDKGSIKQGSILVRDGKIVEVGEKVTVPLTSKRIDGTGKHVLPGLVGLFYPVESGDATSAETRTVTVGGRTFVVPGRSAATNLSFTILSEKLSLDSIDWAQPSRLGITTTQLIAPGYCQTVIAQPGKDRFTTEYVVPKGQLAVSVTNSAQSLDLLRNNLKERSPPSSAEASSGSSRSGFGGRSGRSGFGGGPPASNAAPAAAPPAAPATPPPPVELTPEQKLWKEVRDGERALWVNVNNAATILHVIKILADAPKAKVVWIANGPDIYLTLSKILKDRSTIVLAPQIDLVPNSRNRVNVPAMVMREKISFAFSFGMRGAEMNRAQGSPTFALAVLSKTGLSEEQVLRAATRTPADLLGVGAQVGTIETGKRANLILLDGSPFDTASEIESVYLDGRVIYEN